MRAATPSTGAARPRQGALAAGITGKVEQAKTTVALPVFIFITSLLVPFIINVGPLRMSAYRIVLLVLIIPLVLKWLSGAAGRIRFPDIALLLFTAWSIVSLMMNHPASLWVQTAGILFIETMGPYLLARIYIRTPEDFYAAVALMFRILVCLLPFALIEALTANNVLLNTANKIAPAFGETFKDPRWGLDRVQGTFEHPILYGVFCGSILGLTFMVLGYGKSVFQRMFKTMVAFIVAALALSSGPLTAMTAQILLMGWRTVFGHIRGHWKILIAGVTCLIILIELAANRSSAEIFISYFAFNTATAYNRILIFQFGSASVLNYPLFGIGLNEWERAWFMSSSMDMFWLVHAVRGGLIPGLLMQAIMIWSVIKVATVKNVSDRVNAYRTGYIICLFGYYLAGWTVHYWNATYVHFLFMIGAGLWVLDQANSKDKPDGTPSDDPPAGRANERARAVPLLNQRAIPVTRKDRS
ncbi:MAG: O-antigen ligase domain-containing protein [Pseudomonadota bacterium]